MGIKLLWNKNNTHSSLYWSGRNFSKDFVTWIYSLFLLEKSFSLLLHLFSIFFDLKLSLLVLFLLLFLFLLFLYLRQVLIVLLGDLFHFLYIYLCSMAHSQSLHQLHWRFFKCFPTSFIPIILVANEIILFSHNFRLHHLLPYLDQFLFSLALFLLWLCRILINDIRRCQIIGHTMVVTLVQ